MGKLEIICDWIILIGAVVLAIYNIINICSKPGSKFKKIKNKKQKEITKEIVLEILKTKEEQDLEKQNKIKSEMFEQIKEEVFSDFQKVLEEIREINLKQSQEIKNMNNGLKDILRQKIMAIYHTYRKYQMIPLSEKEKVDELYKDYKAQKGNSYIDKYYKRIAAWSVVPDENFEEEIKEI